MRGQVQGKLRAQGHSPGYVFLGARSAVPGKPVRGWLVLTLAQDMDVVNVFVLVVEEAVAILSGRVPSAGHPLPPLLSCSDLHNLDGIYT